MKLNKLSAACALALAATSAQAAVTPFERRSSPCT